MKSLVQELLSLRKYPPAGNRQKTLLETCREYARQHPAQAMLIGTYLIALMGLVQAGVWVYLENKRNTCICPAPEKNQPEKDNDGRRHYEIPDYYPLRSRSDEIETDQVPYPGMEDDLKARLYGEASQPPLDISDFFPEPKKRCWDRFKEWRSERRAAKQRRI